MPTQFAIPDWVGVVRGVSGYRRGGEHLLVLGVVLTLRRRRLGLVCTVLFFVILVGCTNQPVPDEVSQLLSRYDDCFAAHDWECIKQAYSKDFNNATDLEIWLRTLEHLREEFGPIRSRKIVKHRVRAWPPFFGRDERHYMLIRVEYTGGLVSEEVTVSFGSVRGARIDAHRIGFSVVIEDPKSLQDQDPI